MAMTRARWESTNRARELVLGVLRDSPHDAMTAGEVYAAIVDAELTSSMQTAVVLKFAAADGLVIRETGHTAREVLWRISEAGQAWKPEPYNWKKSRGDKFKAKPQAQAPAISAQGDLRPQNGHKPAPTHPYNVTPAVAKAPRPAPVTRPLPAHLESKPDLPKKPKAKAKTYADLRIAEIKGEKTTEWNTEQNADESAVIHSWSAVVEAIEAEGFTAAITPPPPETEPMPEVTSPEIAIDVSELIDARPSESHEDEAPVTHSAHTCTGHCANHAAFSQADEEAQIDRLAAHQTLRARENYIVHLLTIADEHASTGDDLGCSPVWKTARRLAPVFGLEKTYA